MPMETQTMGGLLSVRPGGFWRFIPAGIVALSVSWGPTKSDAETLDCVIEPRAVVNLVSADQGRIEDILVARGDTVNVGQPLVKLDDEVQRLQVELTELRANSDVLLRSEEVRKSLRQNEFERAIALRERNVTAETVVENAEIELALTKLSVEQAAIAMKITEIEHRQAISLLDRRTIYSPIEGVVVAVQADPGEYASEQLEIMTIAQIDPLNVEVFAPLRLFSAITVGDRLEVTQSAPLEGTHMAEVTVVDQIFDAASGTFGLRLELPNPDGKIPAGTRCLVELPTSGQ